MANGIEQVNRTDIVWSYAATMLQIGAGVFLLPAILHCMPQQTVGLWNIFLTVTSLVMLLDLGFRPSFARNIGYILTGVKELQTEGVSTVSQESTIDYSLLKSTIRAMRKFYRYVSIVVFLLLVLFGTTYLRAIMQDYTESRIDAYAAWCILCIINCYDLYTYYYDALLLGKGYIKRSQQIMVLSKCIYIGISLPLILLHIGLTALVSAQLVSTIIRRCLAKRVFFTKEMQDNLRKASAKYSKEVFTAIMPNAIRVGLTHIGGFLVNKSSILLGSLFLSLNEIASYGITAQVMDVLTRCGLVCCVAYTPTIVKARAQGNMHIIRHTYITCTLALILVMLAGGISWLLWGNWALRLIGSKTLFLPNAMLLTMLAFQFLEKNHSLAASFIQADNRIPFFVPSLISGFATIILLWIFLSQLHWGAWALLFAPGIVQLAYQNWKWPLEIIHEIRKKS